MHKYPSMQINNFKLYCQKTARIQEYVTNAKHYENRNQGGERETFINHFNLIQWLKISETERKQHKLENCMPCNTTHIEISKIHKSVSETSIQILNLSEQIVENVSSILPTSTATKGKKTAQALINVLNPLFENQFQKSFEKSAAEALHLSPIEKSADKKKKELTLLKKNKTQIIEAISVNDRDVENFLASGKSFKQHD
ncbi:unnamed protein product [Mytilus edulis]|uniref:Uncharacterized protein n=1 Tax=Mytilus edulis TaxID=6550 RepID=A0A8S3PQP4_MYTED|nr:unnamed protein product [Mytilus edulis]